MDNNRAQQSLAQAGAAYAASSRPVLPVGLSIVSALAGGAGVALVGQSPTGWLRALVLVGGVLLMGAAFLIPTAYRARSGLHGVRGQVRSDNVVFLICAVVLLIAGLNANSTLSTIYLGIGVFVAIVYFLLLRGKSGRTS